MWSKHQKLIRETAGVSTLIIWLAVSGLIFGIVLLTFVVSAGQTHQGWSDKLMAKKLADDIADKIDQVGLASYDSSVRIDLPKPAQLHISGNTVTVWLDTARLDNMVGTATFTSKSSSNVSQGYWNLEDCITITRVKGVVQLGGR